MKKVKQKMSKKLRKKVEKSLKTGRKMPENLKKLGNDSLFFFFWKTKENSSAKVTGTDVPLHLMKVTNSYGKNKMLPGGPCGGKTTGQARLCTFFENLGWKVFRVPETATVLLGGGVKFSDLTPQEAITFQENLLKTMLQIENTFFALGT